MTLVVRSATKDLGWTLAAGDPEGPQGGLSSWVARPVAAALESEYPTLEQPAPSGELTVSHALMTQAGSAPVIFTALAALFEGRWKWVLFWVSFGSLYAVLAATAGSSSGRLYWAGAALVCALGAVWRWTHPRKKRTVERPSSRWSNNAWDDPWGHDPP